MMVNLEKILQGLLYLLGLVYFIKDALDNYKKHDFRCLLNKAYFVTGILGGIFSMLALSYLLFFLPRTWEATFPLFSCICLILLFSESLYFTSFVKEADFKHLVYNITLPSEYSTWNKKRYFCICFGTIMLILISMYLLLY